MEKKEFTLDEGKEEVKKLEAQFEEIKEKEKNVKTKQEEFEKEYVSLREEELVVSQKLLNLRSAIYEAVIRDLLMQNQKLNTKLADEKQESEPESRNEDTKIVPEVKPVPEEPKEKNISARESISRVMINEKKQREDNIQI
jgi:hypothetical protein